MQKGVLNGLVRNTVHEILEDEISHSRIGWAELARFANESEVNWLSRYIPLMLSDAMGSESEPLLNVSKAHEDLSAFGILSPVGARGLMIEAVNEIILPGLRQYGVETIHAEKYLSSFTIGLF